MKKIVLLLTLLFTLTSVNAQFFLSLNTKGGMGSISSGDILFPGLSSKFSFDIGIDGGYFINKHISLETGIHYNHLKWKTENELFDLEKNHILVETLTWKTIQVPLLIGYYYNFNEINLFANAGIYGDFYINNQLHNVKNCINIGAMGKAGFGYKLSSPVMFFLAATYNRLLTKGVSDKSGMSYGKPYFYGLQFGLSYFFN